MKADEIRGLWLGLLGVTIFALTLPMTRLAVGTPEAPQMSGVFIALGRAVVAAGLSGLFLLATRAPWPRRTDWWPLAIICVVMMGFAFSSNFVYALMGSLLRQWLAQGSRLLWFNRTLSMVLAVTALWMLTL